MIEKLKTKQDKVKFYIIIFLALGVVFGVRHFYIPYLFDEPINFGHALFEDLLDKLFVSTLVTIGLATFTFWLTAEDSNNAKIEILQAREIGEALVAARKNTEKWWFNGGTGRYTRCETLPGLAQHALLAGSSIDVFITIMNPRNTKLLEQYVRYRNGLKSAKKNGTRTYQDVQVELFATIVLAYAWNKEQPLLKIKVGLKDTYSLFRLDLSSSKVVITKEDPKEPAIGHDKGTFFYSAYQEELRQSMSQVQELDMSKHFVETSEISAANITTLLTDLDMINLIPANRIESVVECIRKTKNQYG